MKIKTLSVSEINRYIKKTLDNDIILGNISVKGEISNLKYHTSGHIYFSLKDSTSKVNCVMFKGDSNNLNFRLEDGLNVIIDGKISMYTGSGSIQLYCHQIHKEGKGDLFAKFESLKLKLREEGYFDESKKKILPKYPSKVGVVTSDTGAAIRDIINVIKTRNKFVSIVLYPARVQGEDAYKEIIDGIKFFNKDNSVDLIIVGRGGGSIEELWNFNEEELAKIIYNSNIPIISAVGHEIDFTISDFVADFRASTPSQAAELAVPLYSDMKEKINFLNEKFDRILDYKMNECRNNIENKKNVLKLYSPETSIVNCYLELDKMKEKFIYFMSHKIEIEKNKIENINELLVAYNPVKLLSKGYAIIEDNENNVISSCESLKDRNDISVYFADGKISGEFIPKK